MIEYDYVLDEKGVRAFGGTPNEVYMWCFSKENRGRQLTVHVGKTGEDQSVEDYLFKVP